jgi:hypothetical protein
LHSLFVRKAGILHGLLVTNIIDIVFVFQFKLARDPVQFIRRQLWAIVTTLQLLMKHLVLTSLLVYFLLEFQNFLDEYALIVVNTVALVSPTLFLQSKVDIC